MKKFFLFFVFLLTINFSFALTPLSKNAYLRFGDNQRDVLYLQQILNSDPDTIVAPDGVGSQGSENWFFGKLTESALKKFQEKYKLEVTGKVDFKTLSKLNEIASGKKAVTKKTQAKNTSAKDNDYSDTSANSNPYLTNDSSNTPASTTKKSNSILDNTFISNLLSKYSTLFGNNSQTATQPTTSNTYTPQTPYYNPATGQYQNTQPAISGSAPASSYGSSGYSPYGSSPYGQGIDKYSQSLPFGNNYSGGPVAAGNVNSAGQITGDRGDIGQCRATSFAHATLAEGCVADKADQQNNQRSASGIILSRPGVPAIPAVALPRSGSFGDAVEVKDLKTGKCKAFPLLDRGPGPGPLSKGVCIDLTGSAVDILKGRAPCQSVGNLGEGAEGINQVQYAIISGEKIQPGQVKDCKHLIN